MKGKEKRKNKIIQFLCALLYESFPLKNYYYSHQKISNTVTKRLITMFCDLLHTNISKNRLQYDLPLYLGCAVEANTRVLCLKLVVIYKWHNVYWWVYHNVTRPVLNFTITLYISQQYLMWHSLAARKWPDNNVGGGGQAHIFFFFT